MSDDLDHTLAMHCRGDRRSAMVLIRINLDGKVTVVSVEPADAIALSMRLYLAAKSANTNWRPDHGDST